LRGARREGPVPTLDEIDQVLDKMPSEGHVEKPNKDVIACTLLTGARDGGLASLPWIGCVLGLPCLTRRTAKKSENGDAVHPNRILFL
jgi:hypothetical protein